MTSPELAGKRFVFVLAGEVFGGAERQAFRVMAHLTRVEGADVRICALDDRPGRARAIAGEDSVPWTCVPTPWTGSRLRKAASLAHVALALRRLRPDVLVANTNLPNVVGALSWRLSGASLFVWNQFDVGGTTRFSPGLFRRALKAAPLVVTRAHHARDWLVEQWGADPRRVHVIRGDVALPEPRESRASWRKRLDLEPEEIAVCMLGHLHTGKDHATLLRAWRVVVDRLAEEGRHAVLLLAGRDAGRGDAVKALAFDLDLRHSVRFLGDVEDVAGLLQASDLAVMSSRSEELPLGVLEPMAAGLAVVGTDVPGIQEALGAPDKDLLAPPGDAPALAEAVLRLAIDAELRSRIGRRNAAFVAQRQPRDASREYAELISRALAGSRTGSRS